MVFVSNVVTVLTYSFIAKNIIHSVVLAEALFFVFLCFRSVYIFSELKNGFRTCYAYLE